MEAYLFIAGQRRKRESARELELHTAAARGDEKSVRKQIRDWQEGKLV